jgi:hypothetical protein
MWWRSISPMNPFYRHLCQKWGHPLAEEDFALPGSSMLLASLIGVFGILPFMALLIFLGFITHFLFCIPIGIFTLLLGLFFLLAPSGLGVWVATLISKDAHSIDFEQIVPASVSDAEIVGGYWGGVIQRWHWQDVLLIPILPFNFFCFSISFVFMIAPFGTPAVLPKLVLFAVLIAMGYFSFYWGIQLIGLMLGLLLRRLKSFSVIIISPIILLGLTGIWFGGLYVTLPILQRWLLEVENKELTFQGFTLFIFWLFSPILLGMIAARLAYHFVRNPL